MQIYEADQQLSQNTRNQTVITDLENNQFCQNQTYSCAQTQTEELAPSFDLEISLNQSQGVPLFLPVAQTQSKEIRDLSFPKQKSMLLKMLALIAIAQAAEYLIIIGQLLWIKQHSDNIAPIMFPLSLFVLITNIKKGSNRKEQQNCHPLYFYLLTITFTAETYLFFCRLLDFQTYEITSSDIVCSSFVAFKFFSTLIIMGYLFIEKKKISIYPIILILSGCSLIVIGIYWLLSIDCVAMILYAILLVHGLTQIQSGRFQLNDKEVIFNANALLYGTLVPLNWCD